MGGDVAALTLSDWLPSKAATPDRATTLRSLAISRQQHVVAAEPAKPRGAASYHQMKFRLHLCHCSDKGRAQA